MRYIIAYTQRSGSWLLTDALRGTRIAGWPREPFGVRMEGHSKPSDIAFVAAKFRESRTFNGVSGQRVHWKDWQALAARMSIDPAELHYLLGEPKWILTLRRDRLRQAISYTRAAQTGAWWEYDGRKFGNGREPVYSREAIETAIADLVDQEASWRAYFDLLEVKPCEVYYEDLDREYEATVRRAMNFLGLPHAHMGIMPPRLIRQADERTEEWVDRFTAQSNLRHGPQ